MHYLFVIGMCVAFCFKVNAQQKLSFNQDSLLNVVNGNTSEKQKIQALQDLSDHWLYIDSAKSMQYAQNAFARSVKTNDNLATAIAHYYVAGVYMEHYNLIKARNEFQRTVSLLKTDTSYTAQRYLARTWHNIGAIAQREDNTEEFLRLLIEKACPILERIGDSLLLAGNYYDIGNVFCDIRQYGKAFSYFQKASNIFSAHNGYAQAVESRLGMVKALLYQEDFSTANKKKMQDNLTFSFQLLKNHPQAYPWLGYYILQGMFQQYVNKNYPEALANYNKGLAFADKRQEPYNRIELLNRKYYLFYDQKQYAKARDMAYSVYKENANYPLSRNKLINLKNLIDVEEVLGNKDRAFSLLKEYVDLADTVNKKQTNVKLNLIEQKYEHEKKEREIVELKAENHLNAVELKYNRAILTGTVLALGLLLILLFLGYLLYRNKQMLSKQEKELHEQQIERLRKEQQLNFFNAMIQGQEQERKRLASDLHDGLGGLLSNIKLLLSKNPCVEENEMAQQQHQTILNKLDAAVNELRRIARNMMPETLLRFGLVTALRDFCEDLERSGVKISLQTYGFSPQDDKNQQIMIYRILQELINNAVRHASAKNILVQCIQNEEKAYITVEDDGLGFNLNELEQKKGIGLHNVKNRVSYLNGQLDIQSERHVGTTINIEFNLINETNKQAILV
ncbi:sensor histidine kinase [Olivibacter domesticus]|uniref:histidine kinase n=1 Tax=Olivibacter domesticus TaxID=407022 RepID=A0A1H7TFN3_OLID1|nr:sensor histidine kinase [Olivibacter domesticus]SEL83690.1 Signal transduction histidine kinase [Olivibacter domesticus]